MRGRNFPTSKTSHHDLTTFLSLRPSTKPSFLLSYPILLSFEPLTLSMKLDFRDSLLFLELCDPFRQGVSNVPSEESWRSISQLSKEHGMTPFLSYRTRSLGIPAPPKLMKEWLGYYLYQIAEEKKALRQIKELKNILATERIPFILLKGASAMLRLYPEPGLRTFCDLDILIPAEMVSQFKRAMTMAGYKPLFSRTSPEDEELQRYDAHLDPLRKEEGFRIEPHLSILKGRGEYSIALPEIWRDREETEMDGVSIEHLNIEHFIIHSLLHCARDLHDFGFIAIKGFTDLLYAIHTRGIDWSKILDTSRRWGVEKDILPLMATLNQYWQAEIPLAEEPVPIDINTLVCGVEQREKNYYANLPPRYIKCFLKIRELPGAASRIRYALHLFFPAQENLRGRYGLSSKWSVVPYYFFHFFFILGKFLKGLWYQSRLKT